MLDYSDYRYDNCFWEKEELLYTHLDSRFEEYLSIGKFCSTLSDKIINFCDALDPILEIYKPCGDNSTRETGLYMIINHITKIINYLNIFSKNLDEISLKINDKKMSYESKKTTEKYCKKSFKDYQQNLKILQNKKKSYDDSINQAIEIFLYNKLKNKDINSNALNEKISNLKNKRVEYQFQLKECEKRRVEYLEIQGNIFAADEEFERDCTEELKMYLKKAINKYNILINDCIFDEKQIDIIEKINSIKDTQDFAKKNKSFATGLKRNIFIEYSQDVEYYFSHFQNLKNKTKNKSKQEIKEMHNQISQDVKNFLSGILNSESNETIKKFQEISLNIVNNNLSKEDFEFLLKEFNTEFENFLKWKEKNIGAQDFKIVGEEWDNRFYYMQEFLNCFNSIRAENNELNENNFEYLSNAMQTILKFNDNEDIDFHLCDCLLTLSMTFYKKDEKSKNNKKYISEVLRDLPLMKNQNFWIGLIKNELNEEILKKFNINTGNVNGNNYVKEIVSKKDNDAIEKFNNSLIARFISIIYNILHFIIDSELFNNIIFRIFNNFNITTKYREMVIVMVESNIEMEKIDYMKINKELLLSTDETIFENQNEINKNNINNNDNNNL